MPLEKPSNSDRTENLQNKSAKEKIDSRKNPAKKESSSWREHKSPFVRGFARISYSVWIIVMVVGLLLAFLVSLFLL